MSANILRSVGGATVGKHFRSLASKVVLSTTRLPSYFAPTTSRMFHGSVAVREKEQSDTPLTETVRDFLDPSDFFSELKSRGLDFYTGVPDSLLKDYCAYVTDHSEKGKHVIAANEGCAVGIAAGYHLATRKIPIVYMQNSGFGNTVNPLLSLADAKIYSIPMLLMIGWRGEPGKKDEPQHMVQGKAMASLLTDMNISYEVLPDFIEGARESLDTALHYIKTRQSPYAFLVKRQCFVPYKLKTKIVSQYKMTRERAIEIIVKESAKWDIVVSTTGFASRELYELRNKHNQGHERDFLTVGSMGHATSIALGIAISKPSRQVITLDGDGACLMHMGGMTLPAPLGLKNYKHILLNNGSHDSVGGQPTVGFHVSFPKIAEGCGYSHVESVDSEEGLAEAFKNLKASEGPSFLEIKITGGARKDLGRPKTSPLDNKKGFMNFLDA